MKIETKKTEDKLTIKLIGRLDTTTAPELENLINKLDISPLILDLSELDYISSAGLRVLLSTSKKFKDLMEIVNVKEEVYEVFEITGFIDILKIK